MVDSAKHLVLLWATRIVFALVFLVNMHCAISFIAFPSVYAAGYELSGAAGCAAVQGIGVAFLMWNCTYPAFIISPRRFRVLGWVILVQQAVGFVGEALIFATLAAGHEVLGGSILKFMAFDGVGFVLMAAVFALSLVFGWGSARERS